MIKKWLEKRKNIKTIKEFNLIYTHNILKAINDLIDGKQGLIELIKSFENMEPEQIQQMFIHEVSTMIHNNAEANREDVVDAEIVE